MRVVLRGFVAFALGAAGVLGVAAPGGAAAVSIPYSCETGVPSIGVLSAPIGAVTTATPEPADIFDKVSYNVDLSLPEIAPQAFALNFNYFRVTLDIPPGFRAVTVKVKNPGAATANPAVSEISAQVVGDQIVVDMPASPSPTRRFHFATNGSFSYPYNANTSSGGTAVVLPRIKITAMPVFGAGGATLDWVAPNVDTFTQFFNIGDIPCTPDDPGAAVLSTTVTNTVDIPANVYTDVPAGVDPAVSWAKHLKVFAVAGSRYQPSTSVTRSQAVLALWNMVDRPAATSQHPFTDVPANAPYEAALDWAFSEGVVANPASHKFKPEAPVLRGPLTDMVFRAIEADEASPWPAFAYTDVPTGAAYAEALRWADATGVINEFNGGTKVKPTVAATRADLVRLLFKVARGDSAWFRPLSTTVLFAPA